jgi:hypothetical protein
VVGNVQEPGGTFATVLRVARNDGGTYAETDLVQAPNADWLDLHAATWADYDADGDVDLLVAGNFVGATEIEGKSEIFANDNGVFSPLGLSLATPISSIGRGGAFTWFDLDGDGDLDYLVAGAFYVPGGNGLVESRMRLYRNDSTAANQPPEPPAGLVAIPGPAGVAFAWQASVDDQTPSAALTYDFVVRRQGLAGSPGIRLPQPGGLGSVQSWTLSGLAPGTYEWRVGAVDACFVGSPPAEGTFTIPGDALFADGFASGDTSAWSLTLP